MVQEKESTFLQPSGAHDPHRWGFRFRGQWNKRTFCGTVLNWACIRPACFWHWGQLETHQACGQLSPPSGSTLAHSLPRTPVRHAL